GAARRGLLHVRRGGRLVLPLQARRLGGLALSRRAGDSPRRPEHTPAGGGDVPRAPAQPAALLPQALPGLVSAERACAAGGRCACRDGAGPARGAAPARGAHLALAARARAAGCPAVVSAAGEASR